MDVKYFDRLEHRIIGPWIASIKLFEMGAGCLTKSVGNEDVKVVEEISSPILNTVDSMGRLGHEIMSGVIEGPKKQEPVTELV